MGVLSQGCSHKRKIHQLMDPLIIICLCVNEIAVRLLVSAQLVLLQQLLRPAGPAKMFAGS